MTDPLGGEDGVRPETARVVRQGQRGEGHRAGEGGGGDGRPAQPRSVACLACCLACVARTAPAVTARAVRPAGQARGRQVDDEQGGGELDARREAGAQARPAVAGGPRQVPQHQHDDEEVDLPVAQGLPHGLAPDAQGGRRERHGGARAPVDEPYGEVDEGEQQAEVGELGEDAQRGRAGQGQGGEQEGGEGRVGGGQAAVRGAHRVEVAAGAHGPPLGAVDEDVDGGDVGGPLGQEEEAEGDQTARGGGQGAAAAGAAGPGWHEEHSGSTGDKSGE
ncbi:hypothetical protein GCM10010324_14690 [Streptomyces hiroshimensis]|uniref:Uncharacterized protein n=1 Tax=Streptomyces hiroshimensis TaxID=66424 RepID=A0ABQ2Y722_9ACTN|nr:hypothetical protein GCM10010324_14690 [Streptomyces hiroshimensis]